MAVGGVGSKGGGGAARGDAEFERLLPLVLGQPVGAEPVARAGEFQADSKSAGSAARRAAQISAALVALARCSRSA
ncbi:MAG: hypothetical protein R2712_01350 [Vicinamibacterales bacterium]